MVSDAVWDSREKQQQILQMAIVEHLYQQGMLSVAEELCQVMLALRARGHLSSAVKDGLAYVTQASLIVILLPQSPEFWD